MGKASISIAISGSYNGAAISRAEKSLERLAVRTAAAEGSMSKSWVEAGAKAAEAGGRIYNAGQRVAETGDAMTVGITAPLAAIGAASTKTAADFESSMSRVAGALDDPGADIEGLRQLALQMGADTVFSASEAGAAMEELAKGGLSAADIQAGALKTTMDLAAAGGIGLADAANAVVQSMGAFGLTAGQTSGAANALAGAAAASSADVSDLAQGLSQVSAQANSAGWSIQDTTAVLGAFADAGIKGSDAGTSLKTMLQRLSAPTDQAAGMMSSLGINVRDADGNMLDAASIAGELSSKMAGLDSATRDAAMQTIFGADASRAALVMMNQGAEGIQRYTAATNDQSAAQRLADSQMGETERAIEEMNGSIETASVSLGGALAPAVTDAANAVGAAADSFSALDEGAQSSIVGMGLLVAASGPVLSVSGRIVKGVGSLCTAYGKARQDVGVYADAMTTSNIKSLEAYQANSKLAKALSLNPSVKAAGGVKQYTEAVRDANRQTSLYNSSVSRLEREQKKGEKANKATVESLKQEVAQRKKQMDAANGTVQGFQKTASAAARSTAAVTASSVAMKAAAVAGGLLKAAFATLAPMLVIGGISALASHLKKVEENERLAKAATDGLVSATSKGVSAANAGASALKGYGEAAGSARVDIDSVVESQAQLANAISDTNTTASAQMTQLGSAYQAIQQYANQSDLSTEAQGRLKSAVETVNDMCGTQVSVTDLANGKLSDENGAIMDVTASLGGYVEKKMEQIRLDAQQQNLTDLYKQQADDINALADAQIAYNKKLKEKDSWIEEHKDLYGDQTAAVWSAQVAQSEEAKAVEKARGALESCNTSIENVTTSLSAQAQVAEGSASSLGSIAAASPIVSGAMVAMGADINDFSSDLGDAGISVSDFKRLNDDQLMQLATSWDGTSQSIAATLDGMGLKMGDSGLSAVNALANGMASGKVSVDSATEMVKAAASGDWTGVAARMKESGVSLPASVASGITENGFAASAATESMLSIIALKLTNGDATAAAELLGGNIDQGLANGILNGTLSEEQAAMLGQGVIDSAKASLESHSPSLAFARIGTDVDAGLAQGITGGASGPLGAMAQIGMQLLGSISGVPASTASTGASASSGFARGIGSGVGATGASADRLADAASKMKSGDSRTWGSHLAENFASGISAGINWVSNAAKSIAQAAKDAIGFSVPKEGPWSGSEKGGETSGLHLAQNFAAGMMSGIPQVSAAARALMGSASVMSTPSGGLVSARGIAGSSHADSTMLIIELINEVRALREELGPTIADYAPAFPTERQAKRKVREWTR